MNDGAIRRVMPGADHAAAAPAGEWARVARPRDGGLRPLPFEVLRHAGAGRREAALATLDQLFGMRGRFHAYPLLLDMVLGTQAWHAAGSVFVLGDEPLPPALRCHFDEAVAQCGAFLGLPAPCMLLQLRAETRDLHLTIESFPGLSVMRLSTLSPGYPDGLRAVQYHEVAHCFLTCGVRLLDEGLAHFFASRFAGADLPAARPDVLPPMRVLLSRAADAMFGVSADGNLDVYLSACRAGADLLEAVHARSGAEGIVRLFAAVARAAGEAHIVHLVEQATGKVFPAARQPESGSDAGWGGEAGAGLDGQGHGAIVPVAAAATGQNGAGLCQAALEATFAAWTSKDPARLDAAIAALDGVALHQSPALLDSALGARLNRALLQATGGAPPTAAQLAQLDVLMQSADCLPQGRMLLWRGTRAMLAILLARPNVIKVAVAGQQAFDAFNKAAQLIPDDPDLLVQHAALLLHAPPNYGGDRDLGVAKLRQAMHNPVYREHARQVLLEYGIETAAEPAAPVTATVEAAATAPMPPARAPSGAVAPPVLELRGVVLRLSPAFTLRPGSLTLRRGERVALVGRNGAGKSMLLETVLGLRKPGQGDVVLRLGDRQGGDAAMRRHIGGLLQGYDLPGQTRVSEMMALHQAMYRRGEPAVARALGMDELRACYWKQLSRGQKQRVMLWMALAHVPELAVLDEPTLGLDEWFARALRDLLAGLPLTLLMISHAAADLPGMDRICCMEQGSIVAEGTLDALMAGRVGRHKGTLRGPLSDAAWQALGALPGLVRPPRRRGDGWEVFGGDGFDHAFRQFIEQQRIASFSLEPVSVDDFLADATQSGHSA